MSEIDSISEINKIAIEKRSIFDFKNEYSIPENIMKNDTPHFYIYI